MAKKEELSREDRIKKEYEKLNKIYKNIDPDKKKVVDKLIGNSAFMAVTLEDLQEIITEKGCTEIYQNGANQSGVKKSSEVEVYNSMIKNYASIVKQLTDLLGKDEPETEKEEDELENFANNRGG